MMLGLVIYAVVLAFKQCDFMISDTKININAIFSVYLLIILILRLIDIVYVVATLRTLKSETIWMIVLTMFGLMIGIASNFVVNILNQGEYSGNSMLFCVFMTSLINMAAARIYKDQQWENVPLFSYVCRWKRCGIVIDSIVKSAKSWSSKDNEDKKDDGSEDNDDDPDAGNDPNPKSLISGISFKHHKVESQSFSVKPLGKRTNLLQLEAGENETENEKDEISESVKGVKIGTNPGGQDMSGNIHVIEESSQNEEDLSNDGDTGDDNTMKANDIKESNDGNVDNPDYDNVSDNAQ